MDRNSDYLLAIINNAFTTSSSHLSTLHPSNVIAVALLVYITMSSGQVSLVEHRGYRIIIQKMALAMAGVMSESNNDGGLIIEVFKEF
jgi:hypothetical protein